MRASLSARLLVASVAWPVVAWAGKPEHVTEGEMSRLPEYCAYTQSFSKAQGGFRGGASPGQRPWIDLMGETFWATHHYCWALINANRAARAGLSARERNFLLEGAIADCYYVLNNALPGFPLLPEILLRMGQYYALLGRAAESLDVLEMARGVKPEYWPAYLEMAKVNVTLNRRQIAIDALKAGLEKVPGNPELTSALADLNRKRAAAAPTRAASGSASRPH